MNPGEQLSLFSDIPLVDKVVQTIQNLLSQHAQPSAWELLQYLDQNVGPKARWVVNDAIRKLIGESKLTTSASRSFLLDPLESEDFSEALCGRVQPGREIKSSIEELLSQSKIYQSSASFQEMISFMANFRDYAPFNNMLVRIQNPNCSFYATQKDWEKRFNRKLKEDPHPMLILAPMHPVLLVYDLDQTEGPPLPQEIQNFAKFGGQWDASRLDKTLMNASNRDRIRIGFKTLSSTSAGFATLALGQGEAKMRIVIHKELDDASRYGVLCHELAHIYLGHLGGDKDGWWPSRGNLSLRAIEIEAEAVAYIVTRRAGLSGASPRYISRYLNKDEVLQNVSLDQIAKVSGRLEEMAARRLPRHRVRKKIREGS